MKWKVGLTVENLSERGPEGFWEHWTAWLPPPVLPAGGAPSTPRPVARPLPGS